MKRLIFLLLLFTFLSGCKQETPIRDNYKDIIDIDYTPYSKERCKTWFTDAGSWYGVTMPAADTNLLGFCGPFHLEKRKWISAALIQTAYENGEKGVLRKISSCYLPGKAEMVFSNGINSITQRIIFADSDNLLLEISNSSNQKIKLFGVVNFEQATVEVVDNSLVIRYFEKEGLVVSFGEGVKLELEGRSYRAIAPHKRKFYIAIHFFEENKPIEESIEVAKKCIENAASELKENQARWDGYLSKVLRKDLTKEYDRIAVKAVTTLISNWKRARGALYHEGVVPSHGVGYFMGFWGWDSWKHAVALSHFAPEIAKNQVRAMFDYLTPEGMIIDCIFSNPKWNNTRDSKPPLAGWAISEIFKQTGDSAFVKEMLPLLIKYHQWWYKYRDHNGNGICEFGSVDGTMEAAAWESGMDNAIRYDNTKMLMNSEGAWSMDQESVDLNSFLAYEKRVIAELQQVELEFNCDSIANYFYNKEGGFFFDRRLKDSSFVMEEGTEACIPLWAGIASQEQADKVAAKFLDEKKFATYIPFPTIAADNPKFTPNGYWRGPIWLDQVYFGISGLRKYGYVKEADAFTRNVFDRLEGLKESKPIYENYNTHTGESIEAPNFSWSAAHLLLMYLEMGSLNN